MKQPRIQVVAYAPTEFFHCLHCEVVFQQAGFGRAVHREQRESSLPPDLALEYQRVADLVAQIGLDRGVHVQPEIVDPMSLAGVWLTLRHHLRRFPAILIDGRQVQLESLQGLTAGSASA